MRFGSCDISQPQDFVDRSNKGLSEHGGSDRYNQVVAVVVVEKATRGVDAVSGAPGRTPRSGAYPNPPGPCSVRHAATSLRAHRPETTHCGGDGVGISELDTPLQRVTAD